MSTVTITIGPKSYPVACADGQEAHIAALGAMIAEKYAQLGTARAPLEAQNLLFAALFLADELAEARKALAELPPEPEPAPPVDPAETDALRAAIADLEAQLAAAALPAPSGPGTDLFGGPDPSALVASRLEALATRIEASAAALEAAVASA
jgi:cell division protein ZapA